MSVEANELWCVVLIGTLKKNVSAEGIEQVIKSARNERTGKGITSLEIYANGMKLALIEGQKSSVASYINLIRLHPLYHHVGVVYEGSIKTRFFTEHPLAVKIFGQRHLKKLDSFGTPEQDLLFDLFLRIKHPAVKAVVDFIKSES